MKTVEREREHKEAAVDVHEEVRGHIAISTVPATTAHHLGLRRGRGRRVHVAFRWDGLLLSVLRHSCGRTERDEHVCARTKVRH